MARNRRREERPAGLERVEAEPKVYEWPTEKEKLSTSVFPFIETRIFLMRR